jgi:hypothetical protein
MGKSIGLLLRGARNGKSIAPLLRGSREGQTKQQDQGDEPACQAMARHRTGDLEYTTLVSSAQHHLMDKTATFAAIAYC